MGNNLGNNLWNNLAIIAVLSMPGMALAQTPVPAVPALALHGSPKYGADFTHVDYVNPDAPKGGNLTLDAPGSFDSLNPYIIKGLPASGLGMIYQTLMEKSLDEPMTSYGLVAETVTMPEDRSWVSFKLREQARWQDGKPLTAEDVVWSFNTLIKQGQPFYRSYYANVQDVAAVNAHEVKFMFKEKNNRELPLIVGDLPILPKHYWTSEGRDFSKTTLVPPLGSGPYKIKEVASGRRIVYERVKDWWAKDLPINKGRYNFDTVTMDYYRDPNVAFQAFLAGSVDFRQENIAKLWAQGYDHPAVKSGQIKKESIVHGLPTGMQAFVYNTRRPLFQDASVREALAYAFDFEWANKQLAFGSYKRSSSFFSNSELGATMPIGDAEKALLEPYRDQLPPRVFTDVYQPPKTGGNGDIRANLRQAGKMLQDAGWTMQQGVLKNAKGEAFEFEIVTNSPMFDRWLLPFIGNLKKLGIAARIREIDAAQYGNRMNDFDFDMTVSSMGQSLTPGNEQAAYWGSAAADTPGGMNLSGIKNPVIDKLLPYIVQAKTREELITATRALDRVLQWNFYVIPQWHINSFRIAYWNKLGRPEKNPPYGLPYVDTWWVNRGS
ncbi:MAG: bacterial extracellular solute-binding s, 5 Middle family protein [Alphaproteobacteria bacterium]|nr:bacterial extracellular solute-binding s, 5 Middle family protein [Alphaproteobacteria bacterium]